MASLTSSLTISHRPLPPELLKAAGVGSVFTLTTREGEGHFPHDIRSLLPEVKLGRVKVEVTDAARAVIDGWEDVPGAVVPTLAWIRPSRWGQAIALVAAVVEAIGLGGHSLTPVQDEGWSYPPLPWRQRMASEVAHPRVGLPLFARAAGQLEGLIQDEGLQMHLPNVSDRMWDLLSPHCTEKVRESVERHRALVASGRRICWA